jgi:CrcB protein
VQLWIYLAIAGALGSTARHGLQQLAVHLWGKNFPYGTLIVNVLGSLLLGFLLTWFMHTEVLSKPMKLAITTGFLGAFTTFSTFSCDTLDLWVRGAYLPAISNILLNVILGLSAAGAGFGLANTWIAKGP